MLQLQEELNKVKYKMINEEEITKLIYNIRIFLVNQEEELITNQKYIGFRNLFHRYIVKVQQGTNFSESKYKEYNRILVQLCTKYYIIYWKNRCKNFHNKDFQRNRIKEWYQKEKHNVLKSNYLQVKAYVIYRDINIQNCSTRMIKNQILRLKNIRTKSEKYVLET